MSRPSRLSLVARLALLLMTTSALACSDEHVDPAWTPDTGVHADAGDAGDGGGIDASAPDADMIDAAVPDADTPDGGTPDGGTPDAGDVGLDAAGGPLGTLSGSCGEIDAVEINDPGPFFFRNTIDFGADGYDDPEDLDRLSMGGQEIIGDGNAGGSSLLSEVFAYEVLYRCEGAALLKTETEVDYTMEGKITDLLVELDGTRLGVSVTRAVAFPRDTAYPVSQAQELLEGKLADILESTENVAPGDAWPKQILHVVADEVRHAEALETAWGQIDASIRADTIVVVTISEGEDAFLY